MDSSGDEVFITQIIKWHWIRNWVYIWFNVTIFTEKGFN